jgi:Concanavalin A-like lectin/glucanases superfamily
MPYDVITDRRRRAAIVVTAGSYATYIASLAPIEWLRFNEPSGTTVVNYGSLTNANATFTPGSGAVAQTGQLGAVEAYDFDGAASLATITYNAALDGLTAFTFAALVKADSAGEGNVGTIYTWGNNNTTATLRFVGASRAFFFAHRYATTSMQTVTTTALATGQWYWVFGTYDQSGDRFGRIYISSGGTAVEAAYSGAPAPIASVGTVTVNGVAPIVGNLALASNSWDGLIDEVMWFNRVLTQTEMNNIIQKSNLFL